MKMLISLLLLLPLATACASGPSKIELDAEVKRLCAIDGGVKVYETVKLPVERFDKYGQIRIPPKKDAKPSDEYYYEWGVTYLKTGKPEEGVPDLARSRFTLHRTSDDKLLGESVAYTRRGGDIPGPWHPSHFTCPSDSGLTALQIRVFIDIAKGESK
jgi:hypothetical protein